MTLKDGIFNLVNCHFKPSTCYRIYFLNLCKETARLHSFEFMVRNIHLVFGKT